MNYPSKVDAWVAIVLVLVPGSLLLEALILRSLIVVSTAAFVVVVYALAVLPTTYQLGPDALMVRSGLIRTTIPYQQIRQVRPSHSWRSSPALSLDRIEITYGAAGRTLISPRDRIGFLKELSTRIPGISTEVWLGE